MDFSNHFAETQNNAFLNKSFVPRTQSLQNTSNKVYRQQTAVTVRKDYCGKVKQQCSVYSEECSITTQQEKYIYFIHRKVPQKQIPTLPLSTLNIVLKIG